jgi:hypothetical protein
MQPLIDTTNDVNFVSSLRALQWGYILGEGRITMPVAALCGEIEGLPTLNKALLAHLHLRKHYFLFKTRVSDISYGGSWIRKLVDATGAGKGEELDPTEFVDANGASFVDHVGDTLDLLAFDVLALAFAGKSSLLSTTALREKLASAARRDDQRDKKLACILQAVRRYPVSVQELFKPIASSEEVFHRIALNTAPAIWIHDILKQSAASALTALEAVFGEKDGNMLNALPRGWMLQSFQYVLDAINGGCESVPLPTAIGKAIDMLTQSVVADGRSELAFELLISRASTLISSRDSTTLLACAKAWCGVDSAKWVKLFAEARCIFDSTLPADIPQECLHGILVHDESATFWKASFSEPRNIAALGASIATAQKLRDIEAFVRVMKRKGWYLSGSSASFQERSFAVALPLLVHPIFLEAVVGDALEYFQLLLLRDEAQACRNVTKSLSVLTKSVERDEASIRVVSGIAGKRETFPNRLKALAEFDVFQQYLTACEREQARVRIVDLTIQWLVDRGCTISHRPARGEFGTLRELKAFQSPLLQVDGIDVDAVDALEALVGRDTPSELYALAFQHCIDSATVESDDMLNRTVWLINTCYSNLMSSTNLPEIDVNHINGALYSDVMFLQNRGATKLGDQLSENVLASGLATMARLLSTNPERDQATIDLLAQGSKSWISTNNSAELKNVWASCEVYFPLMTTIQKHLNLLSLQIAPSDLRASDDESMNYVFACWSHVAPLRSALAAAKTFGEVAAALLEYFTERSVSQSTVADAWEVCAKESEALVAATNASDDEHSNAYVMDTTSLRKWKASGVRSIRLHYTEQELRDGITFGRKTITRNTTEKNMLSFDEKKTIDLFQQVQISAALSGSTEGKALLAAWEAVAPLESLLSEMITFGFPIPPTGWEYSIPLFPNEWQLGMVQRKVQTLKGALYTWKNAIQSACSLKPYMCRLSWREIGQRCTINTTVADYTGDTAQWQEKLTALEVTIAAAPAEIVRATPGVDVYEFSNTADDAQRIVSAVVDTVLSEQAAADVGVFLIDPTTTAAHLGWIESRATHLHGVYIFVLYRSIYRSYLVTDLLRLFESLQRCKKGRIAVFAEADAQFFPTAISSCATPRQLPNDNLQSVIGTPEEYRKARGTCRVIASNGTSAGKSETARGMSDVRIPLLDDYSAVHTTVIDDASPVTVWFDVSQYMLVPLEVSTEMGVAAALCSGPVTLALRLFSLLRDSEFRVGTSVLRFHPDSSFIIEQPVMHVGVVGAPAVAPLFRSFVTADMTTLIDCNNLVFSLAQTNSSPSLQQGIATLFYASTLQSNVTVATDALAFWNGCLREQKRTFPELYEVKAFQWMRDSHLNDLTQPLFTNFQRMRVFLVELANLMCRPVHAKVVDSRERYARFASMCIKQAAYISCLTRVEGSNSCEISLAGLQEWGLPGLLVPSVENHKDIFFWDTHFYDSTTPAKEASRVMDHDLKDLLDHLVDSTTQRLNAMTFQVYGVQSSAEHAIRLLKLVFGLRQAHERYNLFEKHMERVTVTPTVFLRALAFEAWHNASVPLVMVGNPAEGKTYVTERVVALKENIMQSLINDRYYLQELGTVLVALLIKKLNERELDTSAFVDRSRSSGLTQLAANMQSGLIPAIQDQAVLDSITQCNDAQGNVINDLVVELQQSFPIVSNLHTSTVSLDTNAEGLAHEQLRRLCTNHLAFASCSRRVVLHPSKLSLPNGLAAIDEYASCATQFQNSLQMTEGGGPVTLAATGASCHLTLDEWTTASQLGLISDVVSKANAPCAELRDWKSLRLTLITNPHGDEELSLSNLHGPTALCPVHKMPFTAASIAVCVPSLPDDESDQYHKKLLLARLSADNEVDRVMRNNVIAMILHCCNSVYSYTTTTQRDIIFAADALRAVKRLLRAAEIEQTYTSSLNAVALVLDVVFVGRLGSLAQREAMLVELAASDCWQRLCNEHIGASVSITFASEACCSSLVNSENFLVPHGIVLEAIKRYLIAMLICAVSEPPIPCSVVDEPGTGKTEAARILDNNMKPSGTPFFVRLQLSLHDVVVHGRADATSDFIEKGFQRAEAECQRLREQDNAIAARDGCKSLVRVLYDEANLSTQSLANKALHQPFDDRRVAVTCLLNGCFDAPNMSRCVNIVNASTGDAHVDNLMSRQLRAMDAALQSSVIAACQELLARPFFHRRDLIFFLRALSPAEENDVTPDMLARAVAANFDGDESLRTPTLSPQAAAVAVLRRHCIQIPASHVQLRLSDTLAADRTLQCTGAEFTSTRRFLALIDRSGDYSDVECLLCDPDPAVRDAVSRLQRVFFSTFADDARPEGLSTSVARFRGVFTEGQRAMLQNWEQHCTPFLSVLNRQLSVRTGTANPICVFPLASGTKKAEVKADTELVVVVKAENVETMLPQVRSRFEMHFAEVEIDQEVLAFLTRAMPHNASTVIAPSSVRSASRTLLLRPGSDSNVTRLGILDWNADRRLTADEARLSSDATLRGALLLGHIASDLEFKALTKHLDTARRALALKAFYRHRPWSLNDIISTADQDTLRRPWLVVCSDRDGFHKVEQHILEWQPRELYYTSKPRYIDAMKISSQAAFEKIIEEEMESSCNPLIVVLSDLVDVEHINFVRFLVAKMYSDALQQSSPPFFVGVLLRIQSGKYPISLSPSWNVVRLPHLFLDEPQKLVTSLLRNAYGGDGPVPELLKKEYITHCAQKLTKQRATGTVINRWHEDLDLRASVAATFYMASQQAEQRSDVLSRVMAAHEAMKRLMILPSSSNLKAMWEADDRMGISGMCDVIADECSKSLIVLQYACYGYGLVSLERATKAGALVVATKLVARIAENRLYSPDHVWEFVPSCSLNPWLLDYIIERADVHRQRPYNESTIQATTSVLHEILGDNLFGIEMLHLFAEDLQRRSTHAWITSVHAPAVLDAWSKALSTVYSVEQLTSWSVLRQAVALVYATQEQGTSQLGIVLHKFCTQSDQSLLLVMCPNSNCSAPVVTLPVEVVERNLIAAVCDECCRPQGN